MASALHCDTMRSAVILHRLSIMMTTSLAFLKAEDTLIKVWIEVDEEGP